MNISRQSNLIHASSRNHVCASWILTLALWALPSDAQTNPSPGRVINWGRNDAGLEVPLGLSGVIAIAAGDWHALALKSDGTVIAWGSDEQGQCDVPSGLHDVTAVAAGGHHSLALKSDGTIVAWGGNEFGQSSVPPGLHDVVALAAGGTHSLAMKSDGTIVAWGDNSSGQSSAPPDLGGVTSVAAGWNYCLALRADGTVATWGDNAFGQSTVPTGLRDVVALAAGWYHSLALKSDGTVVAWGYGYYGQTAVPPDLRDVIGLGAGWMHSLAVKSDGTVVAWGDDDYEETAVPPGLRGVIAVAGGVWHSLALVAESTSGPPLLLASPRSQTAGVGCTVDLGVNAVGSPLLAYQWFFNGTELLKGATNAILELTNLQPSQSGAYTVVVTNPFGSVVSSVATLSVIGIPPTILMGPYSQTALAGSTVEFTVDATCGCQPLAYQWFFNGANVITGATNSVLRLSNVQLAQSGTYKVVVSNVFGAVTGGPAMLSVIVASPGPGTLAVANISGTGAGCSDIVDSLRFTFGYCPGGSAPTHGLFNTLLLTTNDIGRIVPITQADDPNFAFIVSLLTNGIADWVGDNIQVGPCGYGEATLEERYFSPLPAGGNGIDFAGFHIDNLALEIDQLSFTPHGDRHWTDISFGLLLFVNSEPWSRPTILTPPQNQMADVGATVHFEVTASGNPPLGYRWFFNGTNSLSDATNSVLELVNIQPAQAGAYAAMVTNRFGAVTSSPAFLTVVPRPPTILAPPQSQTVGMGSTVHFEVRADGAPPPAYQWFFNETNSLGGATNSVLELLNVQPAQAGTYTVLVTNVVGVVTSPPATLTVLDPYIVSQPASQLVTFGGTVSFGVVAAGTAPLSYQWFKGGVRLEDGGGVSGTRTATLTLGTLAGEDAGGYYVVIGNPSGSVASGVALLNMNRPGYSVLHDFTGYDGGYSLSGLVVSGTTLYGTTCEGGNGSGTAFKLNSDGSGYTLLKQFGGAVGIGPCGDLLLSGTTLYGTAYMGGSHGYGTMFKMNTDGSGYTILQEFNYLDGGEPYAGLVLSGTTLYGVTSLDPVLFKINNDGTDYTVLKRFTSDDGYGPSGSGSLVLSGATLFGAAQGGPGPQLFGTIFKANTDGSGYTVLKSFLGSDGSWPYGGLVLSGTTLYGATLEGGVADGGTVFKLKTDGTGFTVLKHFSGSDGLNPNAGLVVSGNTLYGTTDAGGTSSLGTVFQLNTDGSLFAVLKSFTGRDGSHPRARLALSGGTLYGTTSYGGGSNEGVVFRLSSLPPAASSIVAATPQDKPLNLAVAKLLALASAPDGAPLALSSVSAFSTNGGPVALGTNQLTYTPLPGYIGADSFNYTLSDGRGGYASAFVFVQVLATNQISGNMLPLSTVPGAYVVSFAGIPGRTYSLQRAATVAGPWTTIATVTVGLNGIGTYQDENLPGGAAFYRTTYP